MVGTAKTTMAVSITEELASLVRAQAAAQERPISWVVETLLRGALGRPKKPKGDVARKPTRRPQHGKQVVDANGHGQPAHGARGTRDGAA